jgi:hypothetical protein
MPRDLVPVLQWALTLFAPLPHRIHICWVDLDEVDPSVFSEAEDWACCYGTKEGLFIGLAPSLSRAPLYVLRYLVAHEVLHLAIPPHRGKAHPRCFRVAERLIPGYLRACRWLESRD